MRATSNPSSLPDMPLPPFVEDIELNDYDLSEECARKEDVYEYIRLSREVITCSVVNNTVNKSIVFGKADENRYYIVRSILSFATFNVYCISIL